MGEQAEDTEKGIRKINKKRLLRTMQEALLFIDSVN